MEKMADKHSPSYQPTNFGDTGCVKDCLFSIESEMFPFCNCCSNVVTADLLQCLFAILLYDSIGFVLDIIDLIMFLSIKVNHSLCLVYLHQK